MYVDADKPIAARELGAVTSTPGFTAAVYAANTVPGGIRGWQRVSSTERVEQNQTFDLDVAQHALPLLPAVDHGAAGGRQGRDPGARAARLSPRPPQARTATQKR